MDQELLLVRQALKQGQHDQAHMLTRQYVQAYPADSAGWLLLAKISTDPEQRQAALAQAARLARSDQPAPIAPTNQRLLLLAGILAVLVIAIAATLRLPAGTTAASASSPENRVRAYLDDLVRMWGNPALEDRSQAEVLHRTLVNRHVQPANRELYMKVVSAESRSAAEAIDIVQLQRIYATDPAAYVDAGFNQVEEQPGTLLVQITSPMLVWQDSSGISQRLKLDLNRFSLTMRVVEIDGGWYLK